MEIKINIQDRLEEILKALRVECRLITQWDVSCIFSHQLQKLSAIPLWNKNILLHSYPSRYVCVCIKKNKFLCSLKCFYHKFLHPLRLFLLCLVQIEYSTYMCMWWWKMKLTTCVLPTLRLFFFLFLSFCHKSVPYMVRVDKGPVISWNSWRWAVCRVCVGMPVLHDTQIPSLLC